MSTQTPEERIEELRLEFIQKKNMGYRWYLIQLQLLFNFEHQYWLYLDRKYRYHMKKAKSYEKKIARIDEATYQTNH